MGEFTFLFSLLPPCVTFMYLKELWNQLVHEVQVQLTFDVATEIWGDGSDFWLMNITQGII